MKKFFYTLFLLLIILITTRCSEEEPPIQPMILGMYIFPGNGVIQHGETIEINIYSENSLNGPVGYNIFVDDSLIYDGFGNYLPSINLQTYDYSIGEHVIRMEAFVSDTLYSQDEINLTILQGLKPVANFVVSDTTVRVWEAVTFRFDCKNYPTTRILDVGEHIVYQYDVVDPTPFEEDNMIGDLEYSHHYTVAGTYTISLVASNIYGSDTIVRKEYITVTD